MNSSPLSKTLHVCLTISWLIGCQTQPVSNTNDSSPHTIAPGKSNQAIAFAPYGSSLAIIYAAENPKVKAVALLSPGLNYFGNLAVEAAVKNFGDRNLLLIAAEDDGDSAGAVRKLKAEFGSAKLETKIYPSGGHGTDLFESKVGLEDLIEEFLRKNL